MILAKSAFSLDLLAPTAPAAAPSRPTGLLLITVDTLRADHLDCYD